MRITIHVKTIGYMYPNRLCFLGIGNFRYFTSEINHGKLFGFEIVPRENRQVALTGFVKKIQGLLKDNF